MSLHSESTSTLSRQEFCLALKASRERKGISLDAIAASTKIPAYLFAGLERGDLRRWPKGLFRRSFFRDYIRSIGLPMAESVAEFVRLFPDDEKVVPAIAAIPVDDTSDEDVRLVLDSAWHGPRTPMASRLIAALIDAVVVLAVTGGVVYLSDLSLFASLAIVAVAYFSLATIAFDESPAKWMLSRRRTVFDTLTHGAPAISNVWGQGEELISNVFGHANSGDSDSADEPELATWISDAHRVGPSSSRLRVRIKVSQ